MASILISISATSVMGHDIRHTVAEGGGVVVSVTHADESPLAFGYYEVREVADDALVQVGQTDANGRVVFLPKAAGRYRVRVFSDDGHGVDLIVPVDDAGLAIPRDRPVFERYAKPIVGVGVLLGLFGVIALLRCGRRGPGSR